MKKILGLLIVIGLLVVADVALLAQAETKLKNAAQEGVPGEAVVQADIESMPFLGRVLANEEVEQVTYRVHNVTVGGLEIDRIQVVGLGVQVSRSDLIFKQKATVKGIERGRVAVRLSQATLSDRFGVPIRLTRGRAEITVNGRLVRAKPAISSEGSLTLTAPGAPPLTLPIPRSDLISCKPTTVAVASGVLDVSCAVDQVPAALL